MTTAAGPSGVEERAARPVILTVDDDPEVLRSVERDLKRHYGVDYRVLRADSGASALDALRQLKRRDDPVAMVVADQRMPGMTGVELLDEAKGLFPRVKSILLTAYADTDAAIEAINRVRLDYYVLKPWDPPEERLYPVLDDMLEDWQAFYKPAFEGVRVIGHRWSADGHRLRDFLARNLVPYQWLDVESSEEAGRLLAASALEGGDGGAGLPAVVLGDGTVLRTPSNLQVAQRIGLHTTAAARFFDVLIVGGGPAGLAAAVYAASEGLTTALVEREAPGGQAGQSSLIENYLGFPQGLSGSDLARRALTQARRFGADILSPQEVTALEVKGPLRVLHLADGGALSCEALVLGTGVSYRRLDVPGVDRLTGSGVYYGAAFSEASACTGQDVFVVGGANSAGQAAMFFSRFAGHVTMVVRGESLAKGMSQYLVDQIQVTPNIEVRLRSVVDAVHGEHNVESVTLRDLDTGERQSRPSGGVFVFIGAEPRTEWLEGVVARDARGFLLTGADVPASRWPEERDPYLLETCVPGVFAVGDVRASSVKRVASAVGEGSIAIQFVHRYLNRSVL
ncbi:MAG: FAD-dependent oxidoreductase [Actinomycetota bacterium]|nr:FAD-dependent oxidoreductase [Actinomycetota bacterium]